MNIKDLFKKPIDRPIQGVIKIGQDSDEIIREELDEYVVTNELHRHFDRFFENYRKGTQGKTDKIGVWISGFFGSGKSHFLKILSYLLSDKSYDGRKAISYFDDKISDSRILADMKVAGDTSADVILFNIDAKSDADSKVNKDAIVKVFMKVFNEMQGFCGSMAWIADLERQMTKDGSYDRFREHFKEISGSDWISAREDFYFEEDNIIKALSETTKMSEEAARNWYNKSEANYSLDVDTFAKKVREYIEAKSKETGKKHYVIFLCDEIGQYIGSDNNLMLNLQTVVENLGTECGGRAWVIATSQQDIDSITKVNRDNFSKIIGRFDTRLSLSSANVDEVIKKRLLAKTDTVAAGLKLLYAEKAAIIRNLIIFSDDTPEKRLYADENDFVDVYPFLPYQFNLLQAVFTGIRTHGASGKHLSEGERSLLNAFQEAAIQFGSFSAGTLIPFDAFYKTIETFLDHNIRTVIIRAEESANRLDGALQPDDVAVLKVLFMIKYIDNILPANLDNLATIMVQHIDADKIETKKRIDASLRRLETEKLITRNGDRFIFLTNEEQDINREIREIRIDRSELTDKLGDEIFGILFGLDKKFRYKQGYDYAFNLFIDDRARGTQREEIGIKVITPLFLGGDMSEQELRSMSMRERNIIMALPASMDFIDEMEQALQIDRFIMKNSGRISIDAVEDIKTTKVREAKTRRDRCRSLIIDALKKADMYVSHNKLDIREKEPKDRVNDALRELIESIYTKQNYITKPFYSTEDLRKLLMEKDNQIALDGIVNNENNAQAVLEMSDVVTRSSYSNTPTTMKTLMEYFGKIPYGWNDMDTAGILLTLWKKQEIRLELSGESIAAEDRGVIEYVTKRDYLDRLLIKARIKVSPALISSAKTLAKDLFSVVDMPPDEDGIMARFKELATAELYRKDGNIKDLLSEYQRDKYPGKAVVEKGKKLFEELIKIRDVKAFFEYLNTERETLLDYVEDIADVKKFFKNQREIFDNAMKFINIINNNSSYIIKHEVVSTIKDIKAIVDMPSPYSHIFKLPDLVEKFTKYFLEVLEAECEPIEKDIRADLAFVCEKCRNIDSELFDAKFYGRVKREYDALLEKLKTTNSILEAIGTRSASKKLTNIFVEQFNAEIPKPDDKVATRTKTVNVNSLFAGVNEIATHKDIDALVSKIKDRLYTELEENTVISII